MADNPLPNPPSGPTGAVPPPKKETGKVQPKKETVRINLPPKPTAAPTIKLPTLPPGGPTGAPSAAPALAISHAPAPPPRAATAPGTSGAKGAAPTGAQQRPGTMQQRQAPSAAPSIKLVDKVLVYVATVAALAAAGFNFYVFFFVLKPLVENFQQ
jgi:hypothetical protein